MAFISPFPNSRCLPLPLHLELSGDMGLSQFLVLGRDCHLDRNELRVSPGVSRLLLTQNLSCSFSFLSIGLSVIQSQTKACWLPEGSYQFTSVRLIPLLVTFFSLMHLALCQINAQNWMERNVLTWRSCQLLYVQSFCSQWRENFCPGFRSWREISWLAGFMWLLHLRHSFPSMKDTTWTKNNCNTNVCLLIALHLQIKQINGSVLCYCQIFSLIFLSDKI